MAALRPEPAGPVETWKQRARAAAERKRPDATPETTAAITVAIEAYAKHGISERDAATVKVGRD